jgi:hypothetical protein
MTDEQLQSLHDRATRGDRLTDEEQAALDAWYALQDQAESQLLQALASPVSLSNLQSQVTATVTQLEVVTRHIRETLATNADLRREIARLQRKLAEQTTGRAA